MEQILLIIHVTIAFVLIGLILIQQGKGAEVGASFGSGASQTVFGSQGSGSFLTRLTAILITLFFITCLSLGYLTNHRARPTSIDELINKVQPSRNSADLEPASTDSAIGGEATPSGQGAAMRTGQKVKKEVPVSQEIPTADEIPAANANKASSGNAAPAGKEKN